MPTQQVSFLTPQNQQDLARIQYQQALAQQLMQSGGVPQDWSGQRVTPTYGIGQGLTDMASKLAGAYMQKQATEGSVKVNERMKAERAKAMADMLAPQKDASGAQVPMDYNVAVARAMSAREAGVPDEIIKPWLEVQAEGFTLSPGDERYRGNQMIAARPGEAKLTDDQREYDAAVKQGYKGTLENWILSGKRAGATNVSVNTEKSLYGTLADKQAAQYSELYSAAQAAPESIARTGRIRELLKSQPYTGAGANYKLSLGKAAKAIGLNYAEDDAANTEALAAEMARGTLDNIKASGLAGSQGLTEGERKFLAQAVAGEITLEPKTIERLADLNERTARLTLNRWNETASRLDPSQLKTLGMTPVQQPAAPGGGAPRGKLTQKPDGTYVYTP